MTSNSNRTQFSKIAAFVALLIVVVAIYYFFFKPEVDSVAQNGPLNAQIVTIEQKIELLSEINAPSGLAYDDEHERFLLITDDFHFFVLNAGLNEVLFESRFQDGLEKEGITYLGDHQAVILAEDGTLVFMADRGNNNWVEQNRSSFTPSGTLGSAAYDAQNQHIYTANKTGEKFIYTLDRQGNLIEQFPLRLAEHITANRAYNLTNDYTIAGMTYHNGQLYLFSEAYSTIFKLDIASKEVTEVFGVQNMLESSGITAKDEHTFYIIGDAELYLPRPSIYVVRLEIGD